MLNDFQFLETLNSEYFEQSSNINKQCIHLFESNNQQNNCIKCGLSIDMTDYNYTNKQQKELKVCKFYQLDLAIPMSKEMSREMQIQCIAQECIQSFQDNKRIYPNNIPINFIKRQINESINICGQLFTIIKKSSIQHLYTYFIVKNCHELNEIVSSRNIHKITGQQSVKKWIQKGMQIYYQYLYLFGDKKNIISPITTQFKAYGFDCSKEDELLYNQLYKQIDNMHIMLDQTEISRIKIIIIYIKQRQGKLTDSMMKKLRIKHKTIDKLHDQIQTNSQQSY